MKKKLMSIVFIILTLNIFSEIPNKVERIYIFKIIAFHQRYEIYCTKKAVGYYKYAQTVLNETVYLTYEGRDFFTQCQFDENLTLFNPLYPANLWTNNKGEMLNMKKRYAPVIDKNRKRKYYPQGFGKN